MKHTLKTLLAAALLAAAPAWSQDNAPLGEEAETDIEIINGVPVNPELRKMIMEAESPLSVQELIELSQKVMDAQRDKLGEQNKIGDRSWMGQDPLGVLETEMSDLVSNIQDSDTGEQTQEAGDEVVRKMDTLIAMLEDAAKASGSGGSGAGSGQGKNGQANGNSPANDSTLAPGPGGQGELGANGQGNNRFEHLDPAQRDAILRAQAEQQGFPPEFEALLAEYYQRLASERALATEEPDGTEPAENQ